MVRDRIVIGVNDKMLQEGDLDLKKKLIDCRAAEVSKKESRTLQDKSVDVVRKTITHKPKATH